MTDLREGLGMSIPATMTRFVGTKADRRNGSGTGSPVSVRQASGRASESALRLDTSSQSAARTRMDGRLDDCEREKSQSRREELTGTGALTLLGLPDAVLVLVSPCLSPFSDAILVLFQELLSVPEVARGREESQGRRDRGKVPHPADCARSGSGERRI